ncbi:MAG: TonB-dependent receptor [Gemmatimonadaceae bacterium]|nr:TonB-dependent receptor [Gemmatimonadaceae bacterium]
MPHKRSLLRSVLGATLATALGAVVLPALAPTVAQAQQSPTRADTARRAELPPVQVTATPRGTTVTAAPQPTAVLTGAALRRAQGASLGETLEQLPGVRSLAMTPGIGKPVIRGLTNNRVVTLANGQRTETQQWGHDHSPNVEAADAQQIDVVKGPASVLYGSDALGGVVNVVRRPLPSGDEAAPAARARVALGYNSAIAGPSATLTTEGARGTFGWRISGTGRHSGDIRTPGGVVANSGMQMGYGEVSAGWRSTGRLLTLTASQRDERLRIADDPVQAPGYSGYQRIRTTRATLDGETTFGRQRLQIQGGVERNRRAEFESRDAANVTLGLGSTTINGFAHWHHAPIAGWQGIVGVFGLQNAFRKFGDETLVPNSDARNAAVYLFEQREIGRWSWSAGARYDWRSLGTSGDDVLALPAQSRTFAATTGTLGAVYALTESASIAANVARGFRAPSASDLWANGYHEGTRAYERGDPTVRTETSRNVDLGLRVRRAAWRAEVTTFVNDIANYIYLAPLGAAGSALDSLAVRQGDARLVGLEAQASVDLTRAWRADLSVDGVRAENRATGDALPFIPPLRAQSGLRWQGASSARLLTPTLSMHAEWQDRQRRTFRNDFAPAAYALVHLGGGFGIPTARGVVFVDVQLRNATNQRFRDFLNRYKDFADGAGRGLIVRVSADF